MKKIPVLVYTDIGDDIDDSLAIAYLARCPDIDLVGITCTHGNISYRMQVAHRLLDALGCQTPILGARHKGFLLQTIKKYPERLIILSLAPTTQLFYDLKDIPLFADHIQRIYFQGQIFISDKTISPDMQSYNFKQDPSSIERIMKYDIPMTFVGKYAAYQLPFVQHDFDAIQSNISHVGKMLFDQAKQRKSRLEKLSPETYERLYAQHPDIISYPYDLLAAAAINRYDLFVQESIGNIGLIGQHEGISWIKDKVVCKRYMMDRVYR